MVAIVAGVIGWITSGRFAAKTSEVDNAAKLFDYWEKANHNCREELDLMKEEIKAVRDEANQERQRLNDEVLRLTTKIQVLEKHIKKLEAK